MELVVATGIPLREWLREEPEVIATAMAVLEEQHQRR
jgi:hypothetical protein